MAESGSRERRVMRTTLTSQLEDALRVDIIEGVLRPGQRLRANELAQRYGVSATPLREALQRLAAENLVEIDPRLGAAVAQISPSDLRDILWLRELLEGLALERSIERADDAWEADVRAAWERLGSTLVSESEATESMFAWSEAHRAFHKALLEACDSPWLLRFVATLYDHSERYRILSERSRRRNAIVEHEEIYHAAVERNVPEAVGWLRRHLSRTVDELEDPIPSGADSEAAPDLARATDGA